MRAAASAGVIRRHINVNGQLMRHHQQQPQHYYCTQPASRSSQFFSTAAASSSSSSRKSSSKSSCSSSPLLIDASCAHADWVAGHVCVVPDAISQDEHDLLVDEILNGKDASLVSMRARPYEANHWDSVITNYKELQRPMEKWLDPRNTATLERIRGVIEELTADAMVPAGSAVQAWLPPHIIDLAANGFIDGHVDSVKFSGQFVAGLSLMSTRTMLLTPARAIYTSATSSESDGQDQQENNNIGESNSEYYCERTKIKMSDTTGGCVGDSNKFSHEEDTSTTKRTESTESEGCVRLLLPPRSLYVLKHSARFAYEHSVPCSDTWEGIGRGTAAAEAAVIQVVGSERRISIMFRDDLPPVWMRNGLAHVFSGRIEA